MKFKFDLNSILNIFLLLFLAFVLSQRIPGWIANYKIEETKASQFKATKLSDNSTTMFPINDGKAHVLIFWATWCGPCTFELSLFQKAIENKELPVEQIHAISLGEDADLVRQTVSERKYNFLTYADTRNFASQIFNISGTPTIVHLDPDGVVKWIGTGVSPLAISRAKKHLGL